MQTGTACTCTSNLEEIVFFKLLEDAALDFHELVGYKKREKSMIVRIYSYVQRQQLVYHDEGMCH